MFMETFFYSFGIVQIFTQFTELVEKYFCLGKIQEICAIERKGHI